MTLTQQQMQQLSQVAIRAAVTAGKLIATLSQGSIQVEYKGSGTTLASQVVTEVDRLSQATILDILQPTLAPYQLGLLTEELEDDGSRLTQDHFWCIDPMDGTLAFIRGEAGYAVSIALVSRSGTPLIGVVYDPRTTTLYSAVKGLGAYRNGVLWDPPNVSDNPSLTLICDRTLLQHVDYPQISARFEALVDRYGYSGLKVMHGAGAVLSACWVAEHPPACYFKRPKPQQGGGALWDFAATTCLLQERGMVVTDFNGAALALNRATSVYMHQNGVMMASDPQLIPRVRPLIEP